ncbi:hypothetical protein [Nocardia caishijiensis]|uniref:Uncharacterized protein n=1 Tax=Nocardia caishijiensis TaxID=184756 RepID=A0ABQ6YHP3_9NOCA|nr:hypothetical protein [Nocardia caishijiensis]KAF0845289.1 hypothetical protein FNL39_10897 [Nocardia caishijiensis]
MTEHRARAALHGVLVDNARYAAIYALRHSIDWSAATIDDVLAGRPAEARAEGADQSTLELLIALDDALAKVRDLGDRVPVLTRAALSGAEVAQVLSGRIDVLGAVSEQLARARDEFDELAETEAELTRAGAEYQRISDRIAELDRLRELAAELPALREQQRALLGREAELIVATDEIERDLVAASTRVITLTEAEQERLSARLGQLLGQVRNAETTGAATVERCQRAREEIDALRAEHTGRVAELSAHAEVSKQLLEQLDGVADETALDRVGALLTEAGDLLRRVDDGLGTALRRYDEVRARDHQVTTWSGDS